MEWFRFYHGALDDPKVQRLQPTLFKHWVNLLCLASQEGQRGSLPGLDAIAFRLRLATPKAEDVVGELIAAGLIDRDPCGGLAIHNWGGRQRASDDVAERQRKRRGNVTSNDPVTLHVTPMSLSRATEQIQIQNRQQHPLPPRPTNGADAAAATAVFSPTYQTTLGDASWSIAVGMLTNLSPEVTEGMAHDILCDVERDVGALSLPQLRKGLDAARLSLERAMNGPKPIAALKPFATKVIADRLREVANVH